MTHPASRRNPAEPAPTCPRCLHAIPHDAAPGLVPGAISRVDDVTEICSYCASDEALLLLITGQMVGMAEWPVLHRVDPDRYRALGDLWALALSGI